MPEIKDRESLESWLKDRPQEDAIVIAARAALRALPGLASLFESKGIKHPYAIVLTVFRANAVARVAGNGPTPRQKLEKAARSAARYAISATRSANIAASVASAPAIAAGRSAAAESASASAASAAAADSASAARPSVAAAYFAANVAANAAAVDPDLSFASAWKAAQSDVAKLEADANQAEVLASPLWPERPPEGLAEGWPALRDNLIKHNESWRVWTDWYQDRLDGKPIDEALEIEKALIPDEDWEKGPPHVNAIIAELIEKHSGTQTDKARAPQKTSPKTDTERARSEPSQADKIAALEKQVSELKSEFGHFQDRVSGAEQFTTDALSTIGDFGEAAAQLKDLQADLETSKAETVSLRDRLNGFDEEFAGLKSKLEEEIADTVQRRENLGEIFAEEASQEYSVTLWKEKESEHAGRRDEAYGRFQYGLIGAGAMIFFLLIFLTFGGSSLDTLFPPGKIAGRSILAAGSVLTLFTLLLWFVRLQMKIYLAERHMAQDARERIAFSEVYLTLLKSETSKLTLQELSREERLKIANDAAEQKSLVYAALFRPTQDGIVKDDAGLDPALSAALSKFLTK